MKKGRFPVKSAVLQFYELFNWAGTVPSFAVKASVFAIASPDMSAGRQGLRFRVKQGKEIKNLHLPD